MDCGEFFLAAICKKAVKVGEKTRKNRKNLGNFGHNT